MAAAAALGREKRGAGLRVSGGDLVVVWVGSVPSTSPVAWTVSAGSAAGEDEREGQKRGGRRTARVYSRRPAASSLPAKIQSRGPRALRSLHVGGVSFTSSETTSPTRYASKTASRGLRRASRARASSPGEQERAGQLEPIAAAERCRRWPRSPTARRGRRRRRGRHGSSPRRRVDADQQQPAPAATAVAATPDARASAAAVARERGSRRGRRPPPPPSAPIRLAAIPAAITARRPAAAGAGKRAGRVRAPAAASRPGS